MVKAKTSYICNQCGGVQPKWTGQCQACGAWNTLDEDRTSAVPKSLARSAGKALELVELEGDLETYVRHKTKSSEFNRVCGGGIVPGAVTLVGGDPGIGKSTLLLQLSADLASQDLGVLYVSGEEAIDQIRMRAKRLGVEKAPVRLAAATHATDIIETIKQDPKISFVVIDSIQTMYVDTIEAAPGSVSQVRAAAHDLIKFAKSAGVALVLVGHVTKEGTLAGPRVLEHMVDTVLYFEGDRGHQFRLLRAVKNRFGATDEIGVFAMHAQGLQDVENPSSVFLNDRQAEVSGVAVCAGIEGTRPLLVEIQALVSPTSFGTPRRTAIGWDPNRLAMVLAVLEARCGIPFGMQDVYLSVAGGLRIQEPAADLAVAAALLSALTNEPLPEATVFCGEIGLSGEARPVTNQDARMKEAQKLGFKTIWLPAKQSTSGVFSVRACGTLEILKELFNNQSMQKRGKKYG